MHISYKNPGGSDDDMLARLRTGDPRVVEELYREHAEAFRLWAARSFPQLAAHQREDAYQEAVLCLFENLNKGKLTRLTASLRTYLFAIGSRICKKLQKSRRQTINVSTLFAIKRKDGDDMPIELPDLPELADDPFGIMPFSDEEQTLRDRVSASLLRLTPDCRELLIAFYYHNLSISEIGEEFNHRDAAVTRTRKSQCLSRLRDLVRA